MPRSALTIAAGIAIALAGLGCANRMEIRAIESFAGALKAEDLAQLRQSTSVDFEKKALRLEDSVEDLKILRLPTGKTEIVKVEDLSETEKIVTAEVGESKRKLRYILVKDGKTKKWVVDDVYLKQKHEGVESTKSVTEQMDLLLSVREFFRAWNSGDRDATLAVANPKFRSTLDALPPAYLAKITRDVIGDPASLKKARPEAQLDDNVAVVKVTRPKGQTLITYEMKEGVWLVSDLAIESRGEKEEGIPSVLKHSLALNTAVTFLRAYQEEDRETLSQVCVPKFFSSGLAPADLKTIPLPSGDVPTEEQKFRIVAKRAEMIIPTSSELVKVSLIREDAIDADATVTYRVEDVTIYDEDGGQEKRLSSLFTSRAMLNLFCEALSTRDLPMLRKASTADFNRRVWNRLKQSGRVGTVAIAAATSHTTIDDLPLGEIPPEPPVVKSTKFNGAITEFEVQQGNTTLTYRLREHTGEVRVDDVLLTAEGRPSSLKETTELIVPLREFTAGLQQRDIGLIQRYSSTDYNRLVWKQTDRVPELTSTALRHLRTEITGVEARPEEVKLTLGDEKWGAKVVLLKEFSQFVVDDIVLVGGLEAAHRTKLKHSMRLELANGAPPPGTVDERIALRPATVNHASYEEYQDDEEPRAKSPALIQTGGERPIEDSTEDEALTPPDPAEHAFDNPVPME